MAKRFNYGRIGNLGYRARKVNDNWAGEKNLYCLSATGKGIVAEFYECLVGETKIWNTKN
jgi:hypothetical protein